MMLWTRVTYKIFPATAMRNILLTGLLKRLSVFYSKNGEVILSSKIVCYYSSFSIGKMYELFCEHFSNEENIPKKNVYRKVFCTEYNLSFFHCSKDRCLLCLNFETANDGDKNVLKAQYDEHINRKMKLTKAKKMTKKSYLL